MRNNGKELDTTEYFIDGYKEPLRGVDGGYGYYGVVTKSNDGTGIQSHIDGRFYKMITGSYVKRHGFNSLREYKEHYGLNLTTPLASDEVREHKRRIYTKSFKNIPASQMRVNRRRAQRKARIANTGKKKQTWSLERRNLVGNCPDQVLEKIKKLSLKLGGTPTQRDYIKEYGSAGTVIYHYGTWNNALKLIDLKPKKVGNNTYTKEELMERLRMFHKQYGRTPVTSDFGRKGLLPDVNVYYRHWKTLNAARIQAGVPPVHHYKLF